MKVKVCRLAQMSLILLFFGR